MNVKSYCNTEEYNKLDSKVMFVEQSDYSLPSSQSLYSVFITDYTKDLKRLIKIPIMNNHYN